MDRTFQQQSGSHGVQRVTAMALLVTMGIVFGDIGTSPLYVMKAITAVTPRWDADFIIGAVSCVIWTLTIQTTVKYVLIALRADNHGEGGILALYALLKRHGGKGLFVIAAIGASTLVADGVITPAITVTTAIEGLRGIWAETPVVPIVIGIITVIFFVQQTGTSAIGRWFGPFMLAWFLMLGVLGIANVGHDLSIFRAFNPWYAVRLLAGNPEWFLILGAVFLCTTGAEALYSDLGHCGRMNITVSWLFVKVMLIFNYLGQGAWILSAGPAGVVGVNPFFSIMPSWFVVPGIIMSTGAAIIASQALLSGSFTIFSEAMNLDFSPRFRIKYPSRLKGQLYVPAVNWSLYVGCIITVLLFRDSAGMEAAYGLAITITMLMTTALLGFYLHYKGVPLWVTCVFLVVFVAIEGCFFAANMFKFMHGGWFTLLIAGVICAMMLVWNRATAVRNRYIEYVDLDSEAPLLADISRERDIPLYASNLIYFSRSRDVRKVESKLVYSIVNKGPKRADRYWIISLNHTDDPDTLQYSCRTLVPDTLLRVEINIGFRIQPRVTVYLRQIVEDLVAAGEIDLCSRYGSLRSRGIPGNFRFILIHRIFSPSSNCSVRAAAMMQMYGWLRRLGISDENAMGLDTSNVTVETVPLIINHQEPRRIERVRGCD